MTTYWCQAQTGNDSNDGLSAGAPKKTLAAIAALMVAGDTAFCGGNYRDPEVTFPSGITLDFREPGSSSRGYVTGNSAPVTGWSTEVVGAVTVYKKTLTGIAVANVVGANVNWELSGTNTDPRRKGQLKKVATKANLEDAGSLASGAWFAQTSGSDTILYVRLQGDANPGTKTMRWVRAGNGINFTNSTNVVVKNCTFGPFCDDAAAKGYGLSLGSGTTVRVRNCVFFDCGYHAVGCNGNGAAADVQYTYVSAFGLRAGAGTAFVWYGESGNISGRADGCVAHLYPMLAEDGSELVANGGVAGFYWHAGGTGVVADLTIENCLVQGYGTVQGSGWGGANMADPGDWKVPGTYPAKVKNCRAIDLDVITAIAGSISFDRCILDASRQSVTQGSEKAAINPTSAGSNVFFRSCAIVGNTDNAAGSLRIFSLRGNVGFENCSIYDANVNSSAQFNFFGWGMTGAGTFYARRTLFGRAAGGNGFNITTALIDIAGCWYYNITSYSTDTAVDSQAEWTAAKDATGTYAVAPGWRDSKLLVPEVGGELRDREFAIGTAVGVNGRANSGHVGPYQFGVSVASSGGAGATGADTSLAALVGSGVL